MKKFAVVSLVLMFTMTSLTFAATPQHRKGDPNRGEICNAVLQGEVVEIEGEVVSLGHHQSLVVRKTDGTLVKIHGVGPYWYWEAKGMDKPAFGENVTVVAFAVPFADGIRYVAASITVGGQTIDLRDRETGCPLWRTWSSH